MSRNTKSSHVPPHNIEAEQAVLGGILLAGCQGRHRVADALEMLVPEDFYLPGHQDMFRAICRVAGRGDPTDLVTVAEDLRNEGKFDKQVNAPYLAELAGSLMTTSTLPSHAKIVFADARRREVIEQSLALVGAAYDKSLSLGEIQEHASRLVLSTQTQSARSPETMDQLVPAFMDNLRQRRRGQIPGLSTGFPDLDEKSGGMRKAQLITLAAYTSQGKSVFALNVVINALLKGARPGVFSMEMEADEILERAIARDAMVNASAIQRGRLSPQEWERVEASAAKLRQTPLRISDLSSVTPALALERSRAWQATGGLDLVVVDYLQLLKLSKSSRTRENEVSEGSRAMKEMAKTLQVPVLMLSQVSRDGAKADRLKLWHLRESGSIENDSNQVWFIQPWDKIQEGTPRIEIEVAKNRGGACGSCFLWFNREMQAFRSVDRHGGETLDG
ncbi:replicative DNA helicase [Oceanidesulfovibrio marinus]|uniref:DNA 5'-3' helicase n=1 Tax=Oceanidesulfovibrio marinus TaxID=370038 RepID=A0A6P1ZEZ0_9BACT|nr:DnaB-like helicase C-terminal domain-containing protein [Oceanidesulfovibrio marinus]TVM31199.1 hypothetical protein DQK91_18995 [Oceanidesulfovibrio marinus]